MHPKHADPAYPIHDLLARRWSPYAFSDKPVRREDLAALFEAARWSASSFNEQPWRYFVAISDEPEEHAKMLSVLVEANREWARRAPVLALGLAKMTFTRNGKPNRVALHDLGAASASLTLEATSRGLCVHQMAGILPDRAREVFGIPEDFSVETALAIGYAEDGDPSGQDAQPRSRKPLSELVFSGTWERPAETVRRRAASWTAPSQLTRARRNCRSC